MTVKVRKYRGQEGVWEVDIRFTWPDGSEHRERKKAAHTSKTAAREWGEQRQRHLLNQGKEALNSVEVPTVEAFAPTWVEQHCLANRQKHSSVTTTRKHLRNHIIPLLGRKKLDAITAVDVQALKARMTEHKPKTVNNVLTVLNVMLKKAVEWGILKHVPVSIQLFKAPVGPVEFYEPEEFERLVASAGAVGPAQLALVLLGGEAGLRLGEIAALKWDHVDMQRGILWVQQSVWDGVTSTTKSNKPRKVPMTARLKKAIQSIRGIHTLVIHQDDGQQLVAHDVETWVEHVERRAGMPVTGKVHILRHTFGSRLAMVGASPRAIQELMGHSDIKTTMRYMHLSPRHVDTAVHLLEPGEVGEMLEKPAVAGGLRLVGA